MAVNLGNGNLALRATDVTINGPGLGLSLERFYNGLSERAGAYGPRWSISAAADVGLEVGPGSVVFRAPSGFRARFTDDGNGWEPPAGLQADLESQSNGQWVVSYRRTGDRLVFTAGGYLLRHEDRNGNAISYAYNTDNTIASVTDPAGRVTTFTHDGGKISSITDPAERVTSFTYDGSHRLTAVETPDNATRSYGYTDGRLTSITTGTSDTTAIQYDENGRVTSIDHAGESLTSFTYVTGQTTITDAGDNDTTVDLDSEGRVVSVTDPLGRTRSQEWTPNSQIAATTDAMGSDGGQGNVTSFSYDDANNPTQVSLPTGAAARATYTSDAECGSATQDHPYLVKCASDPAGNKTTYEYDGPGNLMSQTDTTATGGRELSYTRQGTDGASCGAKNGQICTATDGEGGVTSYSYDADGNVTAVTPPAPLAATGYTYDSVGRVATVTDGRGITTTYTYDELDRLTGQESGNEQFAKTYDAAGRMIYDDTLGANQVLTDLGYDGRGSQVHEYIYHPVSPNPTFTMTYDNRGNMTSYQDAGSDVTYVYDAANQLTRVEHGGDVVELSYDANGQEPTRSLPGGAEINREYDNSSRLTRVNATDTNDDTVMDYSYTFADPDGGEDRAKIQSRTDHAGLEREADTTHTYGYDSLNRLISVNENTPTSHQDWLYEYDNNGNRTRAEGVATVFNDANQITSIGGWPANISYDPNGSITERQNHYSVGYNDADQATNWNLGSHQNEMGYLGGTNARRLSVEHDFGTQYELRSPLGLAYTEIDSDMVDPADSRVSYIHTPDGELIGTADSSQGARYVITDHQNTVVGVFSTGELAGSIAYDAWGNEISRTGDLLAIGYAGGETGSPTGLIKFGVRYYDPTLGVFTQMDPAGQEHNPYTYAAADPINNTDPTGLSCTGAIVSGAVGGAVTGALAGAYVAGVGAVP
ncbi:RHS repeat-associated core domain-containing protein, partial [uncultured Aeromicrobium sp.]|uniref:RHS repeat-associated core domain-containing protein n=1 Tax=uncultured Aeromicrobium sp. TaxID=337820 RepID=UPI0025EB8C0C